MKYRCLKLGNDGTLEVVEGMEMKDAAFERPALQMENLRERGMVLYNRAAKDAVNENATVLITQDLRRPVRGTAYLFALENTERMEDLLLKQETYTQSFRDLSNTELAELRSVMERFGYCPVCGNCYVDPTDSVPCPCCDWSPLRDYADMEELEAERNAYLKTAEGRAREVERLHHYWETGEPLLPAVRKAARPMDRKRRHGAD